MSAPPASSVLGPTQPTPHVPVTLPRLRWAVTVLQTCLAQGLSDLRWVMGFCARDPRGDCPAHHMAGHVSPTRLVTGTLTRGPSPEGCGTYAGERLFPFLSPSFEGMRPLQARAAGVFRVSRPRRRAGHPFLGVDPRRLKESLFTFCPSKTCTQLAGRRPQRGLGGGIGQDGSWKPLLVLSLGLAGSAWFSASVGASYTLGYLV